MKICTIAPSNTGSSSRDLQTLLETRQRYARLLDALFGGSPTDENLRSEIQAAVSAIDAKIAAKTI